MEADKDRKSCRAPPKRRGSGIFHLLCINLHLHTLGKKTCEISDTTLIYGSIYRSMHAYDTFRNARTYAGLGSSVRGNRVSAYSFAFQTLRSKDKQIIHCRKEHHNRYGPCKCEV